MDEPPIRSELLLKTFFGSNLDRGKLRNLVARFRDQENGRLERLRASERKIEASRRNRRDTIYWLLTVRRGLLAAEARLRWAEMALHDRPCVDRGHQRSP